MIFHVSNLIVSKITGNGKNNLLDGVNMLKHKQYNFIPKILIGKEKRNKICINSCTITSFIKYLSIIVLMRMVEPTESAHLSQNIHLLGVEI
jgi:hypothetical protein